MAIPADVASRGGGDRLDDDCRSDRSRHVRLSSPSCSAFRNRRAESSRSLQRQGSGSPASESGHSARREYVLVAYLGRRAFVKRKVGYRDRTGPLAPLPNPRDVIPQQGSNGDRHVSGGEGRTTPIRPEKEHHQPRWQASAEGFEGGSKLERELGGSNR